MAAFSTIPNLVITADSQVTSDDGRKLRHAEGGEIRGRSAYAEPVFSINVIVRGTVAVKQALETFYDDYTDVMNSITVDDSDYSVMFVTRPVVTAKDGAIRWIQFSLRGFEV